MSTDETLAALREIPGVEGAFVVTRSGLLRARAMSSIFVDEMLVAAARRASVLADTVDESFAGPEDLVLMFEGFWLVMRLRGELLLGVLTQPRPNLEALRMASTVALRRIEAESRPAEAAVVAPPLPRPTTPPRPAPAVRPAPGPASPPPKKKSSVWD